MNDSRQICWCEQDIGDMSDSYNLMNIILVIGFIPIISIMGIVGNALSIWIYKQPQMRKSSVNLYLSYLGVSDIAVDIGGILLIAADSARRFSAVLNQIHLRIVAYYLPFCYVAQTCSVYFTVLAAFDCYISVCWPSIKERVCQPKFACRSALALFVLSFSYNLVLFNELVVKECVQNGTGEIVTQVCPTDMRLDETYVKVYKVYMYAFFMAFAPFMLLLILNALIISKICQLTQLRKRNQLGQSSRYQTFFHPKNCIEVKTDAVHIVTSNTAILQEQTITVKATCANCTGKGSEKKGVLTVKVKSLFNRQNSYSNGTTSTLTTPISRRSCSRERNYRLSNSDKIDDFYESPLKKFSDGKSAKENLSDGPLMLVMVVALFLVCNSVALIVNIFEATISGEEASEAAREVLPVLIDVGSFLVVFNSSANFLIYIIFSKQFRKVLFRTIVCCWSRQLANDNKQLSTSCSHDENSLLIFENYDTIPTGVPRKVSQNDGTISKEEKSGCFSRDSSINNRGIIELISFADQESPENN